MFDYFEIPQVIARRIYEANINALKKMGKDVARIGSLNNYRDAQLIAVKMTGESVAEITRELSKASGLAETEIERLYDDAARYDYEFAEQFYLDRKQIPYKENKALQRTVRAMMKASQENFNNISHSYAFALRSPDGKIRYTSLAAGYKEVIDKAITAVKLGTTDYQAEMRRVLKQFADSGIRVVDWKSGYSQRIDTAVRRNIMDGLKQLKNETQKIIGNEFGADGYEVSAHMNPAPDHAHIQGRQYTFAEFQAINDGLKRKIGTLNCYHTLNAIILGISKPAHTEEELLEMQRKSEEQIEIDGEKYSRYDCTQMQRKLEKNIRKLKDRKELLKAAGDTVGVRECDRKIRLAKERYNRITEKAGLDPRYNRMNVVKSAKSIDFVEKSDIIKPQGAEAVEKTFKEIGKIDISKYQIVSDRSIITDEVILTDNRAQHIIERRGQDFFDTYSKDFDKIISDPDYIFKDKQANTALVCKHLTKDGNSVNVVLRLVVEGDNPDYKNSIITAIEESDKRFSQRLRNNTPLYSRKVDNSE